MSIEDCEITVRDGRFGVVEKGSGQTVIPFEYDNIFHFYKYDPVLILCRSGKVGAVCLDDTEAERFRWIAPCRYDAFEQYGNLGDLLFRTAEEVRYSFGRSKKVETFSEIHLYGDYLYGIDPEGCKLMRRLNGEVLWSMSNDRIAQELPCGVPCLAYMGENGGLPYFFDTANAGCIIPHSGYYVAYTRELPIVIRPVIVNGKNIVNIVGDQEGINAVEYDGRLFHESVPCEFEEVTVELRLRLRRGGHTEERIIPLPQGRITSDSFFDFADWGI